MAWALVVLVFYSVVAGAANKTFTGTGSFSNATLWNGGTVPAAGDNLRINGTCTFDNGAANLVYGTLNVGFGAIGTLNWPAGGTNTLNVTAVSSSTAGSAINMANGGTLQIRTSWTTTNQTFTPGSGTINWNVTGAASTLPAAITTYNNLTITATGQIASLGVATTVNGNLLISAGTLSVGASNFALSVRGNVTNNATFTQGTGTVTLNGTAAQAIAGSTTTTFNNLTISNTSATVSATSNFNVNGTLNMNGGATLLSPSAAVLIGGTGTLTGTGTVQVTRTAATADFSSQYTISNKTLTNLTVEYNGAAAQALSALTYGNLKTNNASGVTLSAGNATVNGTLTLTTGVVTTNANILITSGNCPGSVSRTSGYVAGFLRLHIPTGSPTCTFDVGGATNYRPINLIFSSITTAGDLIGSVTQAAGEEPNIATSGIDSAADVNRYWTLTNSGVVLGGNYSATFNFVSGDVDGGADTSQFEVERWDGSAWNTTTAGTRTTTSTQATGISAFSNFVSGQRKFRTGTGTFNAFETATAAGAVTGVIKTKVASTAFSLDVVAIVGGAQANSFSDNVTVDLIGNNTLGVSLDANNCPTSFSTVLSAFSAAINGGRSTVSFAAVANSWRDVRARVRWPTSSPTVTSCSTDNFAIRPASITISALDATWETAGTTRTLANTGSSGGNVHKASTSAASTPRPFTLRATAVPASATNYDGSPTAASGFPACGTLCTSVGSLTFTGGSWTGNGVRENATANYSEAGTFNLQLEDTGYAGVDNADGSTAAERTVPATAAVEIGRFVPERFEFSSASTPKLQTFGSSCASRSFTYIGQRFWFATLPSATVKAVNANGGTTTNYPISTSRPTLSESYSDSGAPATLDTGSVGTPTLSAPASGTATYSAAAAGTLFYQRSSTTPIMPFNAAAISLTVSASDSADNAPPNQGIISTPTPQAFSNIAFDAGNEFRYGRMRLLNGSGPTTVDVPVTLSAEYVSAGTSFTTNTADNCTSFIPKNFVLFGHQTNLAGSITTTNMVSPTAGSDGNVSISGLLASGLANLRLLKPTSSVTTGSVKICLDLDSAPGVGDTACQAATPANRSYLQGPWSGSSNYDKDPAGQVTFGLFGAQPRNFIFFRENY